jgi:outer membrane protein
MRTKNFLSIFSLVISFSAGAQVKLLTVEEAIAISLANNYDIQLSRNDSSLAALDYAFSHYAFYPRLNANGAYNFNNNNQRQVLADGTKRESTGIKSSSASASMNLNWTLFDGLKMFITRRKLGELVELTELQIKDQVVTTVADVMKTYYEIIGQEQGLTAVREQMSLSSDRLKLAQYKFDIGTGTKQDVLQAQIDYNAQRSLELSQQTTIIKLKEQLNNLLVVPLTNEFLVADTIIINEGLTLDSIRSNITTTNPQLLLAQKSIDVANLPHSRKGISGQHRRLITGKQNDICIPRWHLISSGVKICQGTISFIEMRTAERTKNKDSHQSFPAISPR